MKNLLSLPERWELAGIGFIQYDSLFRNSLRSLVELIGRALEANASSCPPFPKYEKSSYNLSVGFRDWITKSADWDAERLIGYNKLV